MRLDVRRVPVRHGHRASLAAAVVLQQHELRHVSLLTACCAHRGALMGRTEHPARSRHPRAAGLRPRRPGEGSAANPSGGICNPSGAKGNSGRPARPRVRRPGGAHASRRVTSAGAAGRCGVRASRWVRWRSRSCGGCRGRPAGRLDTQLGDPIHFHRQGSFLAAKRLLGRNVWARPVAAVKSEALAALPRERADDP